MQLKYFYIKTIIIFILKYFSEILLFNESLLLYHVNLFIDESKIINFGVYLAITKNKLSKALSH